jgi:hypothetical protein
LKTKPKRYVVFIILLLSLLALVVGSLLFPRASAKRGSRPVIPPIQIYGVEYRAPNTAETEGVIEAWDAKSHTLLWKKRVYHTFKIPFVEEDAQWISSRA